MEVLIISKKKVLKVLLLIILFFIILFMFWACFDKKSFAKYEKKIEGNSLTEVAKPIFVVNGTDDIKISGKEDTVYNFSVKNYNDTGISQVDMNYYIQIENNSVANLEFVLTKNGENVNLVNNKTDKIFLPSLSSKIDEYQLKIKYNNNPAISTDIDGNVQIKVEAMQA